MTALLDILGSPPGLLPADRCARVLGLSCVTVSARAGHHAPELIWHAPDDHLGTLLEDLQYTLGEGPTLDCIQQGRALCIPDLAAMGAARWPLFLPEALQIPVRATFAFPLGIGAVQLGAFAGYRTTPGPLTLQQQRDTQAFTNTVTFLPLAMLPGADPHHDAPTDLATLHRAEIHQATGMLSIREDVPLDQAPLLLRSRAYTLGRPILDVARHLLRAAPRGTGSTHAYRRGGGQQYAGYGPWSVGCR
ncbi:ANTAR domain-containing protein [Streptomyces venezuelae]|uniref:ANTAR domain-containing protein n=1 Tax=Streptomyces venezuelae TaxID=54571 RepID=UPI00342546B1